MCRQYRLTKNLSKKTKGAMKKFSCSKRLCEHNDNVSSSCFAGFYSILIILNRINNYSELYSIQRSITKSFKNIFSWCARWCWATGQVFSQAWNETLSIEHFSRLCWYFAHIHDSLKFEISLHSSVLIRVLSLTNIESHSLLIVS